MFEAYATKEEDFKPCTPDACSFYDLIEDVFPNSFFKNALVNSICFKFFCFLDSPAN